MKPSKLESVYEDILTRLLESDISKDDVEQVKMNVCGEHSSPEVPTNGELLSYADSEHREELVPLLRRKPTRTASGVSPIAIMTSPNMCPHGKCLYCPGGPASDFSSAQAYTGDGPAGQRAQQNDYDPYGQVMLRLNQLQYIGHPVDKAELILMGGTMTARSHDYQQWFVKRALQAMNDYNVDSEPAPSEVESFAQSPEQHEFNYLEDIKTRNETNDIRCIGITFETKPDWCGIEQIDRMLRVGGTKVEIGVQTTYERINREMHRGHGTKASIDANRQLRDSGFKIGFHMMPGQPGMSQEMCLEDFRRIFQSTKWRPDHLKIYPTLVVGGTRVYDRWKQGDFEPLDNEAAADLVANVKEIVPKYVRIQRVQRDIPADHIEGGVWKSNLRQLATQRLEEKGESCDCIRCREVGHSNQTPSPSDIELDVLNYESVGGDEYFISYEDTSTDLLIGFCRLRFPNKPHRRELQNAGVIRELHVYGSEVGIAESEEDEWQHHGYGQQLMEKAERLTREHGYDKLSVISGIGAREYYRQKLGYHQDGPYVSKRL